MRKRDGEENKRKNREAENDDNKQRQTEIGSKERRVKEGRLRMYKRIRDRLLGKNINTQARRE